MLNIVRTALITYYADNGTYPDTLEALTDPFPANYLSAVPQLDFSYNQDAPAIEQVLTLKDQVIPFKEISLLVDKKSYQLYLMHGEEAIKSFPVGLGKDDATPIGEFAITARVVNPQQRGLFGTRGLVLSESDYAIHGTNDQDSINGNKSNGCIRLLNKDMEELYPFISLGAKVKISADNGDVPAAELLPLELLPELPLLQMKAEIKEDKEENKGYIYTWLN